MVYISAVAGREQLFVRALAGRDVRQLTTDAADHEDPDWSPAGDTIAFVLVREGESRLALMPAVGGPVQVLTPPGDRVLHPSWSRDGRRLVYSVIEDEVGPPPRDKARIEAIDLDTRRSRVLVSGGVNTFPAWSPEGGALLFRRIVADSNSEIFVGDGDGAGARNLTRNPAFDGWPAWSPDGRRIAFASDRGGTGDFRIFVMRADGSDVREVYFPICRPENGGCEIFSAEVPPLAAASGP